MSAIQLNNSMLSYNDITEKQQTAIDRLYGHDSTLLIAGVGLGKCIIGMTAAVELIRDGVLSRVLVIAPLRVCTLTWAQERHRWGHINPDDIAIATGNPTQRSATIDAGAGVVVTNLENVSWVVENYPDEFDGLLIDEISKLKTSGGATFKALRHWVKGLKWRVGMTATPVSESGVDIYGQALLLDSGAALGTRKDAFLQRFFYPTDYNQYDWALREGAAEQVAALLKDLVFKVDDESYAAGLPPVVDKMVSVPMRKAGKDLYQAMKKDSLCSVGDCDVVAVNSAVKAGKLFQIAAGGLYDQEGDLVWSDSTKQVAAQHIIDNSSTPILVVYQFTFELDWLTEHYPDALVIGGGHKITQVQIAEWNAGQHPLMIIHPKSAAHGLNLQYGCHTLLLLSPLWSADAWAQVLGRLRRRGQAHPHVIRHILVTSNSIDLEVLKKQGMKAEREKIMMDQIR